MFRDILSVFAWSSEMLVEGTVGNEREGVDLRDVQGNCGVGEMSGLTGWIGVDLDGTLAHYDGWKGASHIGPPIPKMLERVKDWLKEGKTVKIFTARISHDGTAARMTEAGVAFQAISEWCEIYLGRVIPITCIKDCGMIELWDDRCVQVVPNEGIALQEFWRERWN